MNTLETLDTTLLTDYLDNLGAVVVQQMLDLYAQQSIIYLSEITEAIKENSQELWQERCHKMKGAAGSVGLKQVHALLVKEEKSRASQSDKREIVANMTLLNEGSINAFKLWLAEA